MRFPNLLWAIEESRLAHYELASRIGMDASRFSRCLRGRFEFAPHERRRVTEILGYPEPWLFARPAPPARVRVSSESTATALIAASGVS